MHKRRELLGTVRPGSNAQRTGARMPVSNHSGLWPGAIVSSPDDWHNILIINHLKGVADMARAETKVLAVRPDTHQRVKVISALKKVEMADVAEAAIKALEEKWGINLPLEPAE